MIAGPRPVLIGLLAAAVLAAGSGASAADRGTLESPRGFRDAVTAPLEDLNLRKTDIPAVLERASRAPYAMDGLGRCEAVAAEIGRLDAVLGADLDEPPPPESRSRAGRLASSAHGAAVDAVQGRTRAILPFRGWIRKLTGAHRNDQRLKAAMDAGRVRRGYLKGAGMRMNCAPPAAPAWFTPHPPSHAAPDTSLWMRLWRRLAAWITSLIGG